MKKLLIILYAFLSLLPLSSFAQMTLFQTGNPSALLSGVSEGDMTFDTLQSKGNFGLGTFNGIQGELVALDGKFYQIEQQGKTIAVDLKWKTPWAQLVNFSPKSFNNLHNILHLTTLKDEIYRQFRNKNIPYAIIVKGHFSFLKMRSRTARKALETQDIHEDIYYAKDISGNLIGFWFPEYLLNIAVPGFHFHFLSEDKKLSGHVLGLSANQLDYAFSQIDAISLNFPPTEVYRQADIKAPTMKIYRKLQM